VPLIAPAQRSRPGVRSAGWAQETIAIANRIILNIFWKKPVDSAILSSHYLP
jgi:hypothetical protein